MTDTPWFGAVFVAVATRPLTHLVHRASAPNVDVLAIICDCSRQASFSNSPRALSSGGISMMTVDRQPEGTVHCALRRA
jgi:hypothetical protein